MVPAKLDQLAPGLVGKLAFLCDLFLVVAAAHLATDTSPFSRGGQILASIAIVSWVIAATVLRLYSPFTPRSFADQVVLQGVAAVSVTMVLLAAMSVTAYWLNTELFVGLVFCLGSLLRLVLDTAGRDDVSDEIVIIGTGVLGITTYHRLLDGENRYRKNVIGFLRLEGEPALPPNIDLPMLPASELTTFLSEHLVDEVYIGARVLEHGQEVQRIVEQCERFGVPFAIPVHSVRLNRATLRSSSRATDGYLHYQTMAVKPVQAAFKRLGDIVLSSVALFLLSPLLVGVAVAIKLTSPGPIFFRQVRVGLHGTHFGMLKFRSMVANAEALRETLLAQNEQTGPVFKMKRDPRITAIGRVIRKFSIDELPQLVNILRGDMTIVGPRPPIPTEVSRYLVWQRRRLSVRPGLTCFWQVQGRNKIGFEEWMRLDLLYIDHWSLMLDLRLILATVPVVLGGRGAS